MSYLINGARPIVYPYEKYIMASLFHTIHKNQFLWSKDLNIKNKNKTYRKYLAYLYYLWLYKIFRQDTKSTNHNGNDY